MFLQFHINVLNVNNTEIKTYCPNLICQRCKVDKNVSTQDEFELVPVTKVVAKVKTVKEKKGKKKKKDNQRKERKATQTLAIVLGKIPGGRQPPLHSVHITISGRQLNHDPRIDSGQINIILRTQSFLSTVWCV